MLVVSNYIGRIFEGYNSGRSALLFRVGVNRGAFQGDLVGRELRQKLVIGEEEVLIRMVADLSAIWKQHELFVQTAVLLNEKFPNLRFAFFGLIPNENLNPAYNNPWKYYLRKKSLVNLSGIDAKFIWAGFSDDIPQMMGAIDVLIHPCDIEPFGRVAMEAMAAGRPVVGPSKGGIAETVIPGETGFLVKPGAPSSFAEAVTRLIQSESLRGRLGESGKRHVAKEFSIQQHAENNSSILDQIVYQTNIQSSVKFS